jgi:chromate reductase
MYAVGVLIGSLSSTSINRRLVGALSNLAPTVGLQLTEIPIDGLAMYSQDHDAHYPLAARAFKEAIVRSDAILIATPEYNRSIPGALKNAIDWASRPRGTNAFSGKPSAVIGASLGAIGTAVAQQHLRSILSFCASPELAQPEAYIQMREGLITDEGKITDASTEAFLTDWLGAFHQHIAKTLTDVE